MQKTKTIDAFVSEGINSLSELQAALQVAMQLEFATIPPYLCAQWSIDSMNAPDDVDSMIEDIVVQEMNHFALAGNMLSAINGIPQVANAAFVPVYSTSTLPGGIAQQRPVDLKPISLAQLEVFMQIELPQYPIVALAAVVPAPATIGEFYDTISAGFESLNPPINSSARSVISGDAQPVRTMGDAVAAIALIKGQGEGTPGDPDQPPADSNPAHYYVFREIYKGKQLLKTNGKWDYTGPPIRLPTAPPFQPGDVDSAAAVGFRDEFVELLKNLEMCWKTDGVKPSIGSMRQLAKAGRALIQQGASPPFVWLG